MKQHSAQYAVLLGQKSEDYEEYRKAWESMITYQTALQNVNRILDLNLPGQEQQHPRTK